MAPRGLCALLGVVALSLPAAAHDLKVLGNKLHGKLGDSTTIQVTWGHLGDAVELPVDGRELENLLVLRPSHSQQPFGAKEPTSKPSVLVLDEEGVFQALAIKKAVILTRVRDDDGRHRHVVGPKSSVKSGKPISTERGQQFAKALIVAGKPSAAPKPSGLPFDIVPLDKPADWRVGNQLRYRVLYNGKPLAGAPVRAASTTSKASQPDDEDAGWMVNAKTDTAGVVVIHHQHAGVWLLKATHSLAVTADKTRRYDREAYTTTLTLEIQR